MAQGQEGEPPPASPAEEKLNNFSFVRGRWLPGPPRLASAHGGLTPARRRQPRGPGKAPTKTFCLFLVLFSTGLARRRGGEAGEAKLRSPSSAAPPQRTAPGPALRPEVRVLGAAGGRVGLANIRALGSAAALSLRPAPAAGPSVRGGCRGSLTPPGCFPQPDPWPGTARGPRVRPPGTLALRELRSAGLRNAVL